MQYRKILLLIWISLMFIAAIYFLLQRTGPTSAFVTRNKLDGGGILLLYKDARVIDQKKEDGKLVITIDGKVYVSTERSNIPYVVLTDEAKTELVKGSAVIDASDPYTTAVMVSEGSVSFLPNPSNHIGRLSSIELVPGEKGLVTPNAKGVIKQNNRDVNFMSWVDFKLTFNNTAFKQAKKLIEDTYGVTVDLTTPQIERCRLNGSFEGLAIEDLMKKLEAEFQLQATLSEESIWTVTGEGC